MATNANERCFMYVNRFGLRLNILYMDVAIGLGGCVLIVAVGSRENVCFSFLHIQYHGTQITTVLTICVKGGSCMPCTYGEAIFYQCVFLSFSILRKPYHC